MAASPSAIELDGRRLSWRSAGSGPPLLLVNGYAATGSDWDPTFLVRLSRGHTLLCPDNRGMGGSDLGTEELTVDGMAADLERLLETLEIERLPVVGWSMGGFVAQRLAERSPRRVSSLALLGSDAGGPEAVGPEPQVWQRLTDHSGTPREQAKRLIALLFPAAAAAEIDRRFGELVANARAALSDEALTAQERAMASWHATERAPVAEAPPALVVHGAEDVVVPAVNAAPLAQRWSARLEVFEGAAHAVMAQRPAEVADAVLDIAAG
jgi:pimeloyl-ACP methyl ester carboxylesterase